jgi:hypothetical protein
MSIIGKFTGVILLLIGLVVILLGVYAAVAGVMTATQAPPTGFMMPMLGAGYSAALGGVIILWGLMMAALGEGLFLLAQVVENGREANRLLVNRID